MKSFCYTSESCEIRTHDLCLISKTNSSKHAEANNNNNNTKNVYACDLFFSQFIPHSLINYYYNYRVVFAIWCGVQESQRTLTQFPFEP